MPINIETITDKILFSVCTLVTQKNEYSEMVQSFVDKGFDDSNSEFLFVDNSTENRFDAYDGIRKFLKYAQGTYIIISHQDILLKYDNIDTLKERLDELNHIDDKWAIAANAGGEALSRLALRISDPHSMNRSEGSFPVRVSSVDENFLIIKKDANLAISNDLSGFHFYGTDLAIIADILGYHSYVIDFHLYHKSPGNANHEFDKAQELFLRKYQRAFRSRQIQTTCTKLSISSNPLFRWVMEKKFARSITKRFF